jgi:hypothetical protein
MDSVTTAALGLGFLLGLKHALDADHLVAIATMAGERRGWLGSALTGAAWGLGHTTSLLLAGAAVIGLRLTIPPRVAQGMEFLVAVMLVALGLRILWPWARERWLHVHVHRHGGAPHAHGHLHVRSGGGAGHAHGGQPLGRPFFVGLVHGLAGTAALVLLVLTAIPSAGLGILYIAVFGLGSIGGMVVMSCGLGLPFALAGQRAPGLREGLGVAAGALSTAFGLVLAWQIGVADGLFG